MIEFCKKQQFDSEKKIQIVIMLISSVLIILDYLSIIIMYKLDKNTLIPAFIMLTAMTFLYCFIGFNNQLELSLFFIVPILIRVVLLSIYAFAFGFNFMLTGFLIASAPGLILIIIDVIRGLVKIYN